MHHHITFKNILDSGGRVASISSIRVLRTVMCDRILLPS